MEKMEDEVKMALTFFNKLKLEASMLYRLCLRKTNELEQGPTLLRLARHQFILLFASSSSSSSQLSILITWTITLS